MRRLRAVATTEARSLEFLILAASRLQEARGARFDEIDGDVWTVPSARMKAKRPHRVPLSAAALARRAPAPRQKRPVHLSRSPWRRHRQEQPHRCCLFWSAIVASCTDSARRFVTGWRRHGVPRRLGRAFAGASRRSGAERAYRRGDLLDQRRKLMAAWARYCDGNSESRVVPLKTAS